MENKIKDFKYLEEFELVDNSKQEVYNDKEARADNDNIDKTGVNKAFREKDVYIEPVFKSAAAIEYNIYMLDENNELEKIGTVKEDKQIVLTAKYKERKQLEVDEKEFDFNSQKLEVDIQKMIEEQRFSEEENKEKQEKDTEKNKDQKEEQDKDDVIDDKDLQEQGYNITTYTRIKNQQIIDLMIAENYNPRSMIVTEIDGKPVFLAKEVGTGDIKELPTKPCENSIEEVNEFENNVERTRGTGTKVVLANCPGIVFDVSKNNKNQIGVLADIEKDGKRERFNVGEPVHPTDQEYEMQKYVNAGYNFAPANPLLTDAIIKESLEKMPEDVRSGVQNALEGRTQNPTKDEFDEIVNNVLDEKEKADEAEKEEEHEHYTERYLGDKYEAHP